ncbi:MAG TPA: small metal-binding protein SmbP [Nitrosomonas sp.]|nr:small metal-binding protein SmbP [Nitrosomonas sp.]
MMRACKAMNLGLLGLIAWFGLSACWVENHLHQAIRYAEAAVVADDGETIAKHSETAKNHALMAQSQHNISSADRIHLAVGIVSLEQAIKNGKFDADDTARKAARGAMIHFKEVRK